MPDFPKRKPTRLKNYDYSSPGAYFVTICTEGKQKLLSEIIYVGTDVLGGPQNNLTEYGKIAEKHIENMNNFYDNISVDKYIVMPNHIHLLIRIREREDWMKNLCGGNEPPRMSENGPPRTSVPTDSIISRLVSTFKRFCNKEYGRNVWQYRSHDHIIRNEKQYQHIYNYTEFNALKWKDDCFYCE